jgi:threonyl-tRNA synthetase
MLKLQIGNGSLDFDNGVAIADILNYLKENRDKAKELDVSKVLNDAIVAEFNGKFVDLSYTVTENGNLQFFTPQSGEGLETLRHSAAHIMAEAVLRLFPGTKLGIGPTIKDGFYYDMDINGTLSEEDLPRIEDEINKIVAENIPFVREELSRDNAIKRFKNLGDNYKVELLEEMTGDTVSLYHQGKFTDLCRGPHIPSTKYLKAFKLLSVAGAYWRGNEKNKMLTRVYGTAFADKKELKDYLFRIEEAKKRDHRKLAKELKLFSFHDEGPGLPFWLPRGVVLKNTLLNYMREKLELRNYIEIETPTMLREELWHTSGHIENYGENMFFTEAVEGERYAIKPMNCPGGMLFYKEERHSYREFPLRVAEFGKVHRFERSGQLQGLFRVRGMTQDDAHHFMTSEQIESEVLDIIKLIDEVYNDFGFAYKLELSTKPEKAIGAEEMWEKATEGLKGALDKFGKEYRINEGDGAFYGPKIDYHLEDALGRTHQCGTIQLDMNLPERFGLNYVGADGNDHRVVMVHRAIYGSIERFCGILIEHYGGKFPLWLSPVQATVLPVSDKFNEYAKTVLSELKKAKIRAEADLSSEKLGYKIRKATLEKIPYMLVVGEKEVADNSVSVRHRDKGDLGSYKITDLIQTLLEENSKKL